MRRHIARARRDRPQLSCPQGEASHCKSAMQATERETEDDPDQTCPWKSCSCSAWLRQVGPLSPKSRCHTGAGRAATRSYAPHVTGRGSMGPRRDDARCVAAAYVHVPVAVSVARRGPGLEARQGFDGDGGGELLPPWGRPPAELKRCPSPSRFVASAAHLLTHYSGLEEEELARERERPPTSSCLSVWYSFSFS